MEADPVAGVVAVEAAAVVLAREAVAVALAGEARNNAEALKGVEAAHVKTIAVGSERTPAAATAGASS